MTSLFTCPANWTYWQLRRRLRGTRRWQVPRSTFTRTKVCGWVLGGGASPCQGPSTGVTDPSASSGVWFGPDLQLERNWLEVRPKVEAQVGAWFRRRFSLKGRAEVCSMYIFLLILYQLSVLPLPWDHQVALEQSVSKLLWKGRSPLVCRQVCR